MNSDNQMIEVHNLQFSYNGNFDLKINKFLLSSGKRILLRGPSGAGKTTFLMLLRGILIPNSGTIRVLGQDLSNLSERERRDLRLKRIGSIFQHPTLLPYLTIEDNLKLNRFLGHKTLNDPSQHPLLDQLGLRHLLKCYPKELSGGETQRVSLMRPFIHNPDLVIADEPTNHLDQEHKKCLVDLLDAYRSPNNTTLIVSHDERLVSICDEVIDFSGLKQ
ncbi:MAG: ABC transporter ATP-binding protein [Bacteriovoracaceae bacterium]